MRVGVNKSRNQRGSDKSSGQAYLGQGLFWAEQGFPLGGALLGGALPRRGSVARRTSLDTSLNLSLKALPIVLRVGQWV